MDKGNDIGIVPLRKRQSLADEIVGVLSARITSGDLKLGDQLPTENQLAEAFQVSRSVVREAMARLKQEGVIETQQGKGAFVVDVTLGESKVAADRPRNTRSHVAMLRLTVEPIGAKLAAVNATDADFSEIAAAVAALGEAAALPNGGAEADLRFHLAVAQASGNPLFLSVFELVTKEMKETLALSHGNTRRVTGGTSAVQDEHQAIFSAIRARNGEAAFLMMERHLLRSSARLSITVEWPDRRPRSASFEQDS